MWFLTYPQNLNAVLQKKGTCHVAKKRTQSILTQSDMAAISITGLPYREPEIIEVREVIKAKSAVAQKGGQFYELVDDSLWESTPAEMDRRLFAAVRLIIEYGGPAGKQVINKEMRREALLALVLRIARDRGNQQVLEKLFGASTLSVPSSH